jgi:hypothetical protein
VGTAALVLTRVMAVMPATGDLPEVQVTLPDKLKGQWWSAGVAELAAMGIIPQAELDTLDGNAGISAERLGGYVEHMLPAGVSLPAAPDELVHDGALTRAGLAYVLWQAVQQWDM